MPNRHIIKRDFDKKMKEWKKQYEVYQEGDIKKPTKKFIHHEITESEQER